MEKTPQLTTRMDRTEQLESGTKKIRHGTPLTQPTPIRATVAISPCPYTPVYRATIQMTPNQCLCALCNPTQLNASLSTVHNPLLTMNSGPVLYPLQTALNQSSRIERIANQWMNQPLKLRPTLYTIQEEEEERPRKRAKGSLVSHLQARTQPVTGWEPTILKMLNAANTWPMGPSPLSAWTMSEKMWYVGEVNGNTVARSLTTAISPNITAVNGTYSDCQLMHRCAITI